MRIRILIIFITILLGKCFAGSATVSWDANTESDLAGYKIYYSQTSGNYNDAVDVGNNISWVVDNLIVSATYFFVVTAYDFSGNESGFSDEVSLTILAIIDNRPPEIWNIVWNTESELDKPIELTIIAHGDETADWKGWTVWGHEGDPAGIFILNPEQLRLRVVFDAKIIGKGTCVGIDRSLEIESKLWRIGTTFQEVEFITSSNNIFINFIGDCWIPSTGADANLRIENITIFR